MLEKSITRKISLSNRSTRRWEILDIYDSVILTVRNLLNIRRAWIACAVSIMPVNPRTSRQKMWDKLL